MSPALTYSRVESRSRVRRLILDPVGLLKDIGCEHVFWAEGGKAPAPGPVATWESEISSAQLTQETAANRPQMVFASNMGGLPAVRFDGTDDFLQAADLLTSWGRPVSAVAVFRPLSVHAGSARRLFGLSVSGSDTVTFGKTTGDVWALQDSSGATAAVGPQTGVSYLVIVEYNTSPAADFCSILSLTDSTMVQIVADLGDSSLRHLTLGASSQPANYWNCEIPLFGVGRFAATQHSGPLARLLEWARRYS